jgi:hypothetical protein
MKCHTPRVFRVSGEFNGRPVGPSKGSSGALMTRNPKSFVYSVDPATAVATIAQSP